MSWSTSELRVRLAPLNRFKPSSKIFYWPFQGGTSFVDLLCFCSVLCLLCFVHVCLYVLCGHLLGKGSPLGSRLWCLLWVCHFPIGILGQVWYLIVSIPDLCTINYFYITCECECASRQNSNWKYKQGLKPKLYYPHLVKRQIEQTKSSLGPKEKSVVSEPLFEHHTFATPVREILQLPKTTGKNLHPPMKPRGKQWKQGPLRNGRKWSQKVEGMSLL